MTDPRPLSGRRRQVIESRISAEVADDVAEHLARLLAPRTALDAGCGDGFLVAALRRHGIDATGFDPSEAAVADAPAEARPHVRIGSLLDPVDGRVDLVTCISTAHHVDPIDAPGVVANLCGATDCVLFSSTPVDAHEPTRVDVQPPERWSQLFASHGFYRDFRHDASYLAPWAALYRRGDVTIADLVLDYDRAWAQLRAETLAQRCTILDLQERWEESASRSDPDAENLQHRAEILRLRDALIGQGAELGTARGRVAELQAELHRAGDAAQRLETVLASRSWRLVWALGAPVRLLRRRGR